MAIEFTGFPIGDGNDVGAWAFQGLLPVFQTQQIQCCLGQIGGLVSRQDMGCVACHIHQGQQGEFQSTFRLPPWTVPKPVRTVTAAPTFGCKAGIDCGYPFAIVQQSIQVQQVECNKIKRATEPSRKGLFVQVGVTSKVSEIYPSRQIRHLTTPNKISRSIDI